ncbi:hypothetical protein [Vibrio penaeicida]|uniref:hypothetical protein n=1 Tax=Vibrio penaeicida TaxID=104609 RepID=UPI000CE9B1F6|nr:hypothetical protein [Vibrio penaeicida]
MNKTLFLLLALLSFGASAYDPMQAWYKSEKTDEFSGEITYSAYGVAGYYSEATKYSKARYRSDFDHTFGVRCDVDKSGEQNFMIKFNGKSALATPNTRVNLAIKIDENAPIYFDAKLFSNSYRAGFVRMNEENKKKVETLISQARAGYKIRVRANDRAKSDFTEFTASLRGFTKMTAKTLKACDVGGNSRKMSEEDLNRLKEIAQEIIALEKEKARLEAKY